MSKIKILALFILFVSCSKPKVTLIKQWHLSPNEVTKDIEKSKSLPQFENQIDIFESSVKLVEQGSEAIIAEGCESPSKYFKENFNGWDLSSLQTTQKLIGVKDILAPVPLKLKAKFGSDIEIICGDSERIIKENNLAFSDLKGYVNFYRRLMEFKNKDQSSFDKYKNALSNIVEIKDNQDPVLVARDLALRSLALFQKHIEDRNLFFLKKIIDNRDLDPVLIIGGLHINGITQKLKEAGIEFEVIEPKGYPKEEDRLVEDLLKLLRQYKTEKFVTFQIPSGFNLQTFPTVNLIEPLRKSKIVVEMKPYFEKLGLNPDLLISDFDKDGIRDFTVSTHEGTTVLSAEDNDWDGDGVVNLLDETVGGTKSATLEINSPDVTNVYSLEGVESSQEIDKISKRGVSLLQNKGAKHDALILKIFNEVYSKSNVPTGSLLTFVATSPEFTFGKRSFFSYNKQSKSMEVYPRELLNYLAIRKKKEFADVPNGKFVNSVVVPLLIHSIAHELGHTQDGDHEKVASKMGWSWKEVPFENDYLQTYRLEIKKIMNQKKDLRFNGQSYQEILKEHQEYLAFINSKLKSMKSNKAFKESVKDSVWFVESNKEEREFQTSFLIKKKAPSLYAFSSPKEWFAEVYAGCIFRKFFPQVEKVSESIRYEMLIGFNPWNFESFCQQNDSK